MVNETLNLILALVAGLLFGMIFFGGLWWTVQKGISSNRSAFWFLGSLLLRVGIVVAGFFLVSAGQWERLLACLLGFGMMRLIVTRITRVAENSSGLAKESAHAPYS
jgi:F1F0 ATPase subunit 2